MTKKRRKTKQCRAGDAYIEKAYKLLLKEESADQDQLADAAGSNDQMFSPGQLMRINEYMSEQKYPHRFRVTRGVGGKNGKKPRWALREIKRSTNPG